MEAFLGDTQGELRSALLQELLLLDIQYRQMAGELPAAKDYFDRLPSCDGVLIQGVFGQSPTQAGQVQAATSAIRPGTSNSAAKNFQASCGSKQPETNPAEGKPEHEGLTAEKLIGLLTECGLMSPEEVDTFLASMPPESRPTTGRQVAEALYRHKRLTKFQVQAVYQGKTRGLVMGNYVVLDRLGKGGMGEVYKAQHRRMERVVALKVLPSQATKSEDAVRRFHREVKAAARLAHPNIVTAHDADEHKGVHFLVMEYVDGKDLAALVKERGPLSVVQALDCVLQAARALEYAHQQGVVHRDIKPHNLLLDRKGTVKVLDMGLARIEETVGAATTAPDDGLTMSGQVMGTLDYMSPEQALDTKTADCRSDIYALGCTLHYLLTGSPPYRTDTLAKKILAHRTHPVPSLCAVRQDVPASLDVLFRNKSAV